MTSSKMESQTQFHDNITSSRDRHTESSNDDFERTHRKSNDSERTLFFSPLDLKDAFESSIFDEPEVRTCDCATKFGQKNKDKGMSRDQIIQNVPQQEQSQSPPNHNEVFVLFILVSIVSYAIGYFGFTLVWIMLILYQSIVWYLNVVKDNKERVRSEVIRELAMDKLRRDDGETVEWLNYLLQQIWRTFDPSLLIGLRDMFEDVMGRSAPSFVRATDIEIEIGLIAPRIENIKILPRRENQDDEDVIIGEATFSFRARASTMNRNDAPPHILAWIKTGISAIIPIKVELIGFKASIHFEIKITGTAPFISTGRFSFLNFPQFKTSIMPLIPMNIAQFPIIKQFINNTVKYVLEQFTSPNFIDLDLEQLLTGGDSGHDTQAIGIMKVDIYEARNLTKVDVSGENDPYVISSLDPPSYMHTHSNTRVIEDCASPVWRETFFHKIPELDIVDEHIKIKLCVMDWDRFTTDDHIGSIWIDIKDAIGDGEDETLIYDGWKPIKLQPKDTDTQGELRFRLEYYPKLPSQIEALPEQTSGIFGLKIHQAMNLQITTAPYIEESAVIMSDNHYDTSHPNPYVVIYLNDSRVFRTRAKLNNAAPFWNASTEQFVRDWKTAIVRVVVKDQKDLEYDPVIGIVTLPLKELFEQKKEATKWYPLRHGVGCGKVRLSFLFKTISMKLPPEDKGYDVGTLLIHSITAEGLDIYYANRSAYLTLSLGSTETEQETDMSNEFPPRWLEQRSKNDTKNRMEFAIFRRYRTSLVITLKCKGLFGFCYTVGMAEYCLRKIKDCYETEVEIPIFESLPKCFSATESSQNIGNEELSIPRCESPTSLGIEDPHPSLIEKVVNSEEGLSITSEKATKKVESVVGSTDEVSPDDFGESSQEATQKDDGESDDSKPNTDELSIIAQINESDNNKSSDNITESLTSENKSSDRSSPKSTEIPSTETPPVSTDESTTNILEEETSSEVPSNILRESSTIMEDSSNKIKGFLRFKIYFRPGLSLAHEQDVKRSLTGANASILYKNPFCTMEDIEEQQKREREQIRRSTEMYKERSIPSGETYESETGQERRINRVHRRRTMRQLQWVKDLVKAKVVSMSGKREWENQEIIEQEA